MLTTKTEVSKKTTVFVSSCSAVMESRSSLKNISPVMSEFKHALACTASRGVSVRSTS